MEALPGEQVQISRVPIELAWHKKLATTSNHKQLVKYHLNHEIRAQTRTSNRIIIKEWSIQRENIEVRE